MKRQNKKKPAQNGELDKARKIEGNQRSTGQRAKADEQSGSRATPGKAAPRKKQAAGRKGKPASKPMEERQSSESFPDDSAGNQTSEQAGKTPEARDRCVVVGLGASAGGLNVFRQLLRALPSDTGMAYVLVQHLDPSHHSMMADLLSKYTEMPVVQVEETTTILPNRIYIIPPNRFITVNNGSLMLHEAVKSRGVRMPIDYFFQSLAEQRAERAVCIILSGTGSDGTQGLKEVKAAGGLVIAQRPESAEYDGMPRSAVGTGQVDYIVDIEKMPDILVGYARHPYARGKNDPNDLHDSSPEAFRSILSLLQAHTDYDFRCYKKGTLNRRIQRRMGLRHVENPQAYLKLLRKDHEELRALFKDLLIGVTRFFREHEAWDELSRLVIAPIVKSKGDHDTIRVWVPGCSTGEEAYTIAMLIHEQCRLQQKNPNLQLYATDLDDDSIALARQGQYPSNIAADITEERLNRYFLEVENNQLRVAKHLREVCVFAVQNIVSDPPFSNLDLISCRNLLIYLESQTQRKLMKVFHFALRTEGYLFLGPSESASKSEKLFTPISQQSRIYRRLGGRKTPENTFPIAPKAAAIQAPSESYESGFEERKHLGTVELARRTLLDRFAPASVLVDREYEVQYFHGNLRDFLITPGGEPTRDLLSMAAEGLRSKLRGAMRQALTEGIRVEVLAPRVKTNGSYSAVRIVAEPVQRDSESNPSLLLVTFMRDSDTPAGNAAAKSPQGEQDKGGEDSHRTAGEHAAIIEQLDYELQATREDLQGTIEELETSNEELKASNEEVMSMNEELQSTNEELETSREELQSLNEELSTVNAQLEEKVDELEQTNNDLSNLLNSTDIATFFLDTRFCIRSFTASCTDLLHIIPSDTGRPISDLSSRFNDSSLLADAQKVLDKLQPVEREITNAEGRVFTRRILPYRTSENRIDGVVVTFADVSRIVQMQSQLEVRVQQQAAVAELGRLALTSDDLSELYHRAVELLAKTLNANFAKVLEYQKDRHFLMIAGHGWKKGMVGNAIVDSDIGSQAGYTFTANGPIVVNDLSHEKRFNPPPLLTDHDVHSGLSVVLGSDDDRWGVLGVHATEPRSFTVDDVSFLESIAYVISAARTQRVNQQMLTTIMENSTQALIMMSVDGYCMYCNQAWLDMTGFDEKEIRSKKLHELVHHHYPDGTPYPIEECPIDGALPDDTLIRTHEDVFFRKDGSQFPVLCAASPIRSMGPAGATIIEVRDMSLHKQTTLRLRQSEQRLRLAQEASGIGIWDYNARTKERTWDDRCRELWGFEKDEPITREEIMAAVHEDDRDALQAEIDHSNRPDGEGHFRSEYRVVNRKDGIARWVLAVGHVTIKDGTATRMIGTLQDITSRKETEEKLLIQANELEERVTERTAIAERRARELRGLAAQIGQAEQRARNRVARMIHDDLQQLLIAAKMRLPSDDTPASPDQIRVVSEMLNEALGTSRRLVSDLSPSVLREGTLTDAMEWLARRMQDQHKLRVSVNNKTHEEIRDESLVALLFECVRELLFNIVKHAEVDTAELTVLQHDGLIEVSVADQGTGFNPVDAFEHHDGFGLFSVKERIEAFGGEVAINSAVGEGSKFSIIVPTQPNADEADGKATSTIEDLLPRRPTKRDFDPIRVLIVDDHEIVREGLLTVLERAEDIEVVGQAVDGVQAVERAHDLDPDVVIMDFSMPRMNGAVATEKIRKLVPAAAVIGLSLYESEEMAQTLLDAGAVAYIQKDKAPSVLVSEIRKAAKAETN